MIRQLHPRSMVAGAFAFAAAGLVGCSDPITAPAPTPLDAPRLAAGGLAVGSARVLPMLPTATSQYALASDANDLGQVVGTSSSSTFAVPVVWDAAGVPQELQPLAAGQTATVNAISEDGRIIVGYAYDGTTYQATRWLRSGASWVADALPILGGTELCVANETNADGSVIVGYCYSTVAQYSAAVAWRSGFPQALGSGTATGVNEAGQVVGYSSSGQGVLWTLAGGIQNLGTLGGLSTTPQAINASGNVTGYSDLANGGGTHAFLWTERKGMVDLGASGNVTSAALDLNDGEQVVGYVYYQDPATALSGPRATLWAKGKTLDLGVPLGYSSSVAQGITNSGMIVGYISGAGSTQAVVWQLR